MTTNQTSVEKLWMIAFFLTMFSTYSSSASAFTCDNGGTLTATANACNLPIGTGALPATTQIMCPNKTPAPNGNPSNCSGITVTQHELADLIYSKFFPNAPRCDVEGSGGSHNLYASIQHPDRTNDSCEYNDMTLFNGLLCAADLHGLGLIPESSIGCKGVRDAQAADGRWWRSSFLRINNSLGDRQTFSPDMDLGVQLYVATTHDITRYQNWLNWLDANTPCSLNKPFSNDCWVRGLPRFCITQECTLRPQDIKMIRETTSYLGIDLPHQLAEYDNTLQTLINVSYAIPIINLAGLTAQVANSMSIYDLIEVGANNENTGFPLHLEGIRILLLRYMHRGNASQNAQLDRAAARLVRVQPENPFFLYLKKGGPNASPDNEVLNLFMQKCPANHATNISKARAHWAWQSADSEQRWLENSLWDCSFMAELIYGHLIGNTSPYVNPAAL
jgi:hypothetical protein